MDAVALRTFASDILSVRLRTYVVIRVGLIVFLALTPPGLLSRIAVQAAPVDRISLMVVAHPSPPMEVTLESEEIRQAYARLTVHEFLLEILYAQHWAQTTEEDAENARNEILRLMRSAYASPDVSPDDLDDALPMLQDAQILAERFLEKVISRSSQIREALARGGDSQT